MGMTDTERSSLKPEHADRAGEGLLTAGMQQLEEQRASLSRQWVDGAVRLHVQGFQRCRSSQLVSGLVCHL